MATLLIFILIVCANLVMYRKGYYRGQIDAYNDISDLIDEVVKEAKNGQKVDSSEDSPM